MSIEQEHYQPLGKSDDLIVFDWIADNASRNPDKPATIDLHSGRRHSYTQMDKRAKAHRQSLEREDRARAR